MATPIAMPRQGNTVESCVIQQWFKKKGDSVKQGEILFSYETDKASFEFESPVAGTLLEVFCDKDEDVPVLTNVAVIGEPGESVDAFRTAAASEAIALIKPVVSSGPMAMEAAVAASPALALDAAIVQSGVSPRARKLASESGILTGSLAGTGPKGRVIERDVRLAIEKGPRFTHAAQAQVTSQQSMPPLQEGTAIGRRISLADISSVPAAVAAAGSVQTGSVNDTITEVKLSNMRKIIGSRMLESLQQAAQLTMHTSANATSLLAYRSHVKKQRETLGLADINITDLVLFAVSRILPRFPDMNALYSGDSISQYKHAHVAMAVDTPRGLMVPVVRFADMLSLNDFAQSLKSLAKQCVDGSINPDFLSGGTFTVSNLGAFGIESFTPVLNRPQVGLLGVNTILPRPVMSEQGSYEMQPHIGLSLTIDHRALDGAAAARFLKTLVTAIENISLTISL